MLIYLVQICDLPSETYVFFPSSLIEVPGVPANIPDLTGGQALVDLCVFDNTSSSLLKHAFVVLECVFDLTTGHTLADLLDIFVGIVDIFVMSANVRVCSREWSVSCFGAISSNALKTGLLAILDITDSEGDRTFSLHQNMMNKIIIFVYDRMQHL